MSLNYTKDGSLGGAKGGESWHGQEISYLRMYKMVKGGQGAMFESARVESVHAVLGGVCAETTICARNTAIDTSMYSTFSSEHILCSFRFMKITPNLLDLLRQL
jgi:hypothetical protein